MFVSPKYCSTKDVSFEKKILSYKEGSVTQVFVQGRLLEQHAFTELTRFVKRMDRERSSVVNSMSFQPASIIRAIQQYIRDLRQILRAVPLRERTVGNEDLDHEQPIGIEVTWNNEDWDAPIQTCNLYFEYACMLYNLAIAYYKDGLQYVAVQESHSTDTQSDPGKTLEAIRSSILTMETIVSVCVLAYQSDINLFYMSFNGLSAVAAIAEYYVVDNAAQGNVPHG